MIQDQKGHASRIGDKTHFAVLDLEDMTLDAVPRVDLDDDRGANRFHFAERSGRVGAVAAPAEFGGMVLSADEQSAEFCGRTFLLSPIEFRLLACLVSAQGKVVTHDYLMSRVWGAEYVDSRHYLHLYIRYLREKLEADRASPRIILSEWGIGYRFQPVLESEPS